MASAVTSIYNNVISAASAGFAPTNSADVSAIASAYQVVSATATQLYAGTAYVTSVNDNPISASRAGQAANASMANSAYYDGTGRLISALPDSATVSAIASSYAESAASSKQDTLTFGYNTADQISSIDGSALGGMDEAAVSAIASAYAESAAIGKQDALTFGYDTASAISSIDGSALAGGGGEADWSAESGQPGYIENKPVPKTLVAGAGITITENSTELVVASTNTLYTAGSGLTLNGTTFAVDTAVVQGKITYGYDASGNISGIDGSSLAGSDPEAADLYVQSPLYTGVSGGSAYIGSRINQTVLWTGTGTTTGGTITLSESLANFERYGMYYYIPYQESGQTYYQEMVYKSGQTTFGIKTDGITNTLWRQYIDYGTMNETSISIVSGRQGGFWLTGTDRAFSLYDGNERHHYFTKVIGINRTAGE